MTVKHFCDECEKEIERFSLDTRELCTDCTGSMLLLDSLEVAKNMGEKPQPTDELERLITQRNRLFHILLKVLGDVVGESAQKEADELYDHMVKIVGNTYLEGCNIVSGDDDPHSEELVVPPERAEVYKRIGLMVLAEVGHHPG